MRITSKGRAPPRGEVRHTESSPLTMGRRVEGWGGVNPPQTRPEACLGVMERHLPTNRLKLRLGGGECLDRSQSLLTQSQCERERSGVRPAQRRGATGHYEQSQPSNAAIHHRDRPASASSSQSVLKSGAGNLRVSVRFRARRMTASGVEGGRRHRCSRNRRLAGIFAVQFRR